MKQLKKLGFIKKVGSKPITFMLTERAEFFKAGLEKECIQIDGQHLKNGIDLFHVFSNIKKY